MVKSKRGTQKKGRRDQLKREELSHANVIHIPISGLEIQLPFIFSSPAFRPSFSFLSFFIQFACISFNHPSIDLYIYLYIYIIHNAGPSCWQAFCELETNSSALDTDGGVRAEWLAACSILTFLPLTSWWFVSKGSTKRLPRLLQKANASISKWSTCRHTPLFYFITRWLL